MLLSIVIPVYNGELYIKNCLDSIFHQRIPEKDFEVICVNDGSIDRSLECLQEYQKLHTNLYIHTIPNSGQGKARNVGIELAKGEYLYFVDCDDYISYDSLHIPLQCALNYQLDMCFFGVQRIVEENLYKKAFTEELHSEKRVLTGIDYFAENNINNGPWHFFIQRSLLEKGGLRFVEGRCCEDGMFLVDCILKARRCAYCNVDVYRYVKRENSTMTQKDREHQKKVIHDFIFTVEYLNRHLVHCEKKQMSTAFLQRLRERRNSYIFFLQSRMVKIGTNWKEAGKMVEQLKKWRCYPYGRLDKQERPGYIYSVLGVIYNYKFLFQMFCVFYALAVRINKNLK